MKYKKYLLYLDNENKQRFLEKGVSKEEQDQIEFGLIIKKRLDNGKDIDKVNKEGKSYIPLLKTINNIREGNPNIFNRKIYFEKNNKRLAKKKIIKSFEDIMKGRSAMSLQNLGFITETNLAYVGSLKEKEGKISLSKKQKKDGIK